MHANRSRRGPLFYGVCRSNATKQRVEVDPREQHFIYSLKLCHNDAISERMLFNFDAKWCNSMSTPFSHGQLGTGKLLKTLCILTIWFWKKYT